MCNFLGLDNLEGKTFLDIGCGSGLFSYAAHQLGAKRIVSFDVDPFSVRCCNHMKERVGNPNNWEIIEGSILNQELVERLGSFDVVYSWGVLHHTGAMWDAIRNAAGLVKPGGRFYIAIYNRLEYDTLKRYRGSHGWLRLKKLYNRSGWLGKRLLEGWFAGVDIAKYLLTFRNPFREIRNYQEKRGMSWWYDIVDGLGGYPYEFATTGEVFNFCHVELGFQLERLKQASSIGCHEFLFIRSETKQVP